jgi:hypothetical protein
MFDYIFYKMQHQQRFVVRAHHERFVNAQKERLSPYIQKHSSDLTYQVHILLAPVKIRWYLPNYKMGG